MAFLRNRWAIVSMLVTCWAMIASVFAAYYWIQYADVMNRIGGTRIHVNVGFNNGSGLGNVWHNDTEALIGMTALRVTKAIASVTYRGAIGYGAYVTSIDGVTENSTHGWVWWKWDIVTVNWTMGPISSGAYAVADDETFLWYYESALAWPPAPPP